MTENPFAQPSDDDRAVVRPLGAREPAADATAGGDATVAAAGPVGRRSRMAAAAPEAVVVAAAAGSPLIVAAAPLLQLLARLRNTLTSPDPGELRERAVAAMRRFERNAQTAGVRGEVLEPAHYAVCASLDDVVLNTPWGSHSDWTSHSLISTFHNEVRSGKRFFEILIGLRQNPAKFLAVLELMYQCLSLGFMGPYRLSPRGPAEIDSLREEIYAAIASVRPPAEVELSPAWRGVDAPYRPARPRLPLWVAASAGLAVLGGLFVWLNFDLAAVSDAVYERALHTPPVTMPAIARSEPAQAPKVAAETEPGALDRLKTFLQPEIAAGQVAVLGSQSTPILRLREAGLFGAGSAAVESGSVSLLERIGAALKGEAGPVQVVGYTDDQPIRTVRFPSNFQLSAARAGAAGAIVAETIGDRARLSTEGRADADPVAPNTTADGRAANRRIEIILHRQG
ncbi:MAG TPA: type IVB secretion system protein IcmH/DotU [Rhodopila sp.]|jgi:type VI secretion system protein ImpK